MSVTNSSTLISPYGGKLVDLSVPPESYTEFKEYASQLASVQISSRSACDLELLATGAFSPLTRFMGRDDFQHVLHEMRLADGHIFPIPITLAVEPSSDLHLDDDIALRNNEYELIAIMTVEEIYEWDHGEVADKVFGSRDMRHPVIAELCRWGAVNISGRLQVLHLPRHFDFHNLWLMPSQCRAALTQKGRENVVAFQPHNEWEHANRGPTIQTMKTIDGTLLLHPVIGLKKLGDIGQYAQISAYRSWTKWYYKPNQILLALLPLASRMAGPREALWQALVHRNYGANHMIVGRDHASPNSRSEITTFYGPYDAQVLVEKYSRELGVKMVPEQEENENVSNESVETRSTSFVNTMKDIKYSNNDRALPDLDILPEVTEILANIHLPRYRQGVCIWFTGLSGSGKSTTAEMLTWLLMERGRQVTVLDGDVVRTHLSKGLGFSKVDRDTNVRRIGFVASELVRLGGIAICAVVSPYRIARSDVRNMVGNDQFVEVFVNTPLHICETRDVKGFYAKARRDELKGFTGIDDPYEPPEHPEITLDTVKNSPEENANFIVEHLIQQGFVRG